MVRQKTIVALSTAAGFSGIGVIRISGSNSLAIAERLSKSKIIAKQINYLKLYSQFEEFDQAIILYFPEPHSFTGESVIEIQMHGSPILVKQCLTRLFELGAEAAEPGEFSERAYLNNKMDLAQAESIMDIIHAGSLEAARAAQQTLQGKFSEKINIIAMQMLKLRASVELALDFPDEEVDFINIEETKQNIDQVINQLHQLIESATQGNKLTEGVNIAIVGAPNVGKSTLLNALLQKERAIVSNTAGTTRDTLNEQIVIEGLLINLIDTAGIHQTDDSIELEGIKRSLQSIEQADLVLYLSDNQNKDNVSDLQKILAPKVLVITKCDLKAFTLKENDCESYHTIGISAQTNQGIKELKELILKSLSYQPKEALFSVRERHINCLQESITFLKESLEPIENAPELTAESIRLAHNSLQKITGKVIADDVLGEIFSNFCIGK